MITRHYAYAGERRIHYRRAGGGPPLVLLHASPGSSAGLESLILELAGNHTVIAIDTPGYGESEALDIDRPSIGDYAQALVPTLDALNLEVVDLYGTHTGAKITLEFAVEYPERVRRVIIDGIGLYTAEERADRLANYTPSLEPKWDGSHLVPIWAMRREMFIFAPWYNRSGQGRHATDMRTPDQLHDMAVDFLRTGPGYWRGYHAAFLYDSAPALERLRVPSLLVAARGDSLLEHLRRINKVPPSVSIEVPDDLAARILEFLSGDALADAPLPVAVTRVAGTVRRDYVSTSVGQILIRKAGAQTGRPLVLLNSSPTSSLSLEPLLLRMGADRPVYTLDNPGNGDSAALPGTPTITDVAGVVLEAIQSLGIDDYDVYGTQTGALLAMEVAIADASVRHLILDGVTMFSAQRVKDYVANYAKPMEVRADGTQLLWAWNFLRDACLWWPWFKRTAENTRVGVGMPSPEALQREFVEFIKGGRTFHLNYQAAFVYPTRERLPLLTVPVCLCASPANLLADGLAEAGKLTPNAIVMTTPGNDTPEAANATADWFRSFLADAPLTR
jgi:pimeloyl-ACP methyl ester carboxylesterase